MTREKSKPVIVNFNLGGPEDSGRNTKVFLVPQEVDVGEWGQQFGELETYNNMLYHHLWFYRSTDGTVTSVDYVDLGEMDESEPTNNL